MYTREISNRLSKEFKYAFNDAIAFADTTQEAIASALGVTQAQISNWCNPTGDRNFPMALFPLLPSRMQQFLISHMNAQSADKRAFSNLNGSVDDEIISMMMLETDLKKRVERDPKSAKKTIAMMRELIEKTEAEVDVMISKRQ